MRAILLTLGLAVGYLTGTYVFSTIFDPMVFLQNSNVLAANSYLMGCMDGALGDKIWTPEARQEKAAQCKVGAKQLFDKLETLRKDPGHKQ